MSHIFRPLAFAVICLCAWGRVQAADTNAALPAGCERAGPSAAAAVTAPAPVFPPIQLQIRTPLAPTVLPSAGRAYLVYELHLQNYSAVPMTLRGIEVLDAGHPGSGPVAAFRDGALNARLRRLTIGDGDDDKRMLGPGQGVVAFLCLAFDGKGPVPARLRHRVLLEDGFADGPALSSSGTALRVLGRPLAGADWWPDNNPSLDSHHRTGLWVADGVARISRRYAIDWRRRDADGRSFKGDPRDVRAYHAYGQKVLAVADGVVVEARDGYPDNIPRTEDGFETAVPITLESVAGNRVVLDLGGQYAYYAHLQPGSVRVKTGDRIRRGMPLARIGNSGDAREPHLHFQLTDSPDVLASEGLPLLFERYRTRSDGGSWKIRTREYPMGDTAVDFGPEMP
ncbi:MAG: M23 family metallopeptidase [Ramlibacter sp.]